MELHPKFDRRLGRLGMKKIWCWMKSFGSEGPKGTSLFGNAPYLPKLQSFLNKGNIEASRKLDVVKRGKNKDGKATVTGGSDLKGTQAYQPCFGLQIALAHQEWVQGGMKLSSDSDAESSATSSGDSYSCLDDLVEV